MITKKKKKSRRGKKKFIAFFRDNPSFTRARVCTWNTISMNFVCVHEGITYKIVQPLEGKREKREMENQSKRG